MWEESQAENTKLRLELSGVRSDLETARHQLDGAEKRVSLESCNATTVALIWDSIRGRGGGESL